MQISNTKNLHFLGKLIFEKKLLHKVLARVLSQVLTLNIIIIFVSCGENIIECVCGY